MAFPCPRCGDRYTQSLPMAYGSGTYIRNWRSRSGYGGTTVSQSIVGSLASPPVKRSVWKPMLGLLLLVLLLVPALARAWNQVISGTERRSGPAPIVDGPKARHRHHQAATATTQIPLATVPISSDEGFLYFSGFGLLLAGLLLWWLVRAIRFNRSVYPQQMRNWQLAFLCKQCGAIFYPPDAASIVTSP